MSKRPPETLCLATWAATAGDRDQTIASERTNDAFFNAIGCVVAGPGNGGGRAVRGSIAARGRETSSRGSRTIVGGHRPAIGRAHQWDKRPRARLARGTRFPTRRA